MKNCWATIRLENGQHFINTYVFVQKRCQQLRPISLISLYCKLLEKILRHFLKHINNYIKISNRRLGFTLRISTVLYHPKVTDSGQPNLMKAGKIDVSFLHFRIAFDTVPCQNLLQIITQVGVFHKTLK